MTIQYFKENCLLQSLIIAASAGFPWYHSDGSSSVVKIGTRVKNIKLVDGDHDIDCKVDGIGPMKPKSEFVKKA